MEDEKKLDEVRWYFWPWFVIWLPFYFVISIPWILPELSRLFKDVILISFSRMSKKWKKK